MPCYHPLRAGLRESPEGRTLVWGKTPHAVPGVKAISLPCGRCIGCKIERGRQWAVRLMHENKLHEESFFATLTFKDECLPENKSLSVRTAQLFIKKLRAKIAPTKIKFFLSGEYGEKKDRPHYHCIIFGWLPPDPHFWKNTEAGYPLYTSKTLDAIWGNGDCNFGQVSFDTASYVAKYTVKKITGNQAAAHYHGRLPEFAIMSRGGRTGGGIAKGWIRQFQSDVYPSDEIIANGKPARPPRYYDQHLEKTNPEMLEDLKKKRELAGAKLQAYLFRSGVQYLPEMNNARRLAVREIVATAKAELRKKP